MRLLLSSVGFKFSSFGKRIIKELAVEFEDEILDGVRGWLVERISQFTEEELVYAIHKKVDLWANSPQNYRNFGINLVSKFPDLFQRYRDKITGELVLEWLKLDTPDKWWVITKYPNNDGVVWLDEEVRRVLDGVGGQIPNAGALPEAEELR